MDIKDYINVVHDRDGWIKCDSKSSVLIPRNYLRVTGLKKVIIINIYIDV